MSFVLYLVCFVYTTDYYKQLIVLSSFTLFLLISIIVYYTTSTVQRYNLPVINNQLYQEPINITIPIIYHTKQSYDSSADRLSKYINTDRLLELLSTYSSEHYTYTIDNTVYNDGLYINQDCNNNTHVNNILNDYVKQHSLNTQYNTYNFTQTSTEQNTVYTLPTLHIFDCNYLCDNSLHCHTTESLTLDTNRIAWIRYHNYDIVEHIADTLHNVVHKSLMYTNNDDTSILQSKNNLLSFTLLTNDNKNNIVWDFNNLYTSYLQYFINKLKPIVDISVDSQIIYIDTLIPYNIINGSTQYYKERYINNNSINDDDDNIDYIDINKLYNIKGYLDWNIQSMFVQQSIEIIIYVPNKQTYFYNNSILLYNTLIIPDYGFVVILNKQNITNNNTITVNDMKRVFSSIYAQLRNMLHLANTDDIAKIQSSNTHIDILQDSITGITDYEYDSLLVSNYIQHTKQTKFYLDSLYKLVDDVSEIPVSQDISQKIQTSLHYQKHAYNAALVNDWYTASILSSYAYEYSYNAFYDPSMLPSLYFPNQHLYAVYAPLFLPISLPIISAWVSLLRKRKTNTLHNIVE